MEKVILFKDSTEVAYDDETVVYKGLRLEKYSVQSDLGEDRIAVSLIANYFDNTGKFECEEDEAISVNLPSQLLEFPESQFFFDVSAINKKVIDFLIEEGYVSPTGMFGASGFNRYPVFELEKLN